MNPTSMAPYDLSPPRVRDAVVAPTVLACFATLSMIARFASRYVHHSGFKWDDWIVLLAMLLAYGNLIEFWVGIVNGGIGRKLAVVGFPDLVVALKATFAFELTYVLSMTLLKIGVILFYIRLFGSDKKFVKYATWLIWAILFWWPISWIQILMSCHPMALNWNPMLKGTCGNRPAMFAINGTGNGVLDLLTIALPLPVIMKLKLPLAQKLGLAIVFALGFFITAITGVRLNELVHIDFVKEPLYTLPGGLEWSCIEQFLAIVNANLPALRSLYMAVTPKNFSLSSYLSHTFTSKKSGGRSTNISAPHDYHSGGNSGNVSGHARHGYKIESKSHPYDMVSESHEPNQPLAIYKTCDVQLEEVNGDAESRTSGGRASEKSMNSPV